MTVQPAQIQPILDKIIASGRPRAVFLIEGEIVSCPAGGQIETGHLHRPEAIFVGTYDCEASEAMLLEDLRAAGAGTE
ncbi:MAG: hypothetical protein AB1899_10540 [Pseudomonadota bacterium]